MIVVRLTGGLGNQLFQYAAGRWLALHRRAELVLEDSFYFNAPPGSTARPYELDKYPITARRTTAEERFALRSYTGRFWKRVRRLVPLPGPLAYAHERLGQFEERFRDLPDGVFLDGYWQSERYFTGSDDILREEFNPSIPMSPDDLKVVEKMAGVASISLHVRRGDYVTNGAANAMHGLCGLDYYHRAIRYMAERVENPFFFIFSDDLQWVAKNLAIDFPHRHVEHNALPATAFQDLRLMSSCRHHIVANSSFSWWGAWLNSFAGKIVVRPKIWFSGLPGANVWACPSGWVTI